MLTTDGTREALAGLPEGLQRLMTFERHHLYRPEDYEFFYQGIDSAYFPRNSGVFELPCFWLPHRNFFVYECEKGLARALGFMRGSGRDEEIMFPVHPLSLSHYRNVVGDARASERETCLLAIPTSSPRTLLAWPQRQPERACFIKTTMLIPRSCGDWHLRHKKVASCVGLTKLLKAHESSIPPALKFIPEPLGIVPKAMQDSAAVVRTVPAGLLNGEFLLAPMFSLIGGTRERPPILLTLAERGPLVLQECVEETLCANFAETWLELAFGCGLFPEAHGQNLLLSLTSDYEPSGKFFYKDLDGLTVDWELQRARGWQTPEDMPCAWAWYETYSSMFPGQKYWELVSLKARVSLFAYLRLLLNEVNKELVRWTKEGWIVSAFREGDLTKLFSHHLREAIRQKFGAELSIEYDIDQNLNRFIASLLEIRRDLLANYRTERR